MIAKVIPKIKLPLGANSVFDYEVPKELNGKVRVGQVVEVEFRRKVVEAMILEIRNPPTRDHPRGDKKQEIKGRGFQVKPILRILDEKPVMGEKQIETMKWMADYYYNPITNVFKMLAPDAPKPKTKNKKSKTNIKNLKTNIDYGDLKLTVLKSRLGEIKRVIDEIIGGSGNVIFQWNDLAEKILVYIKLFEYYSSQDKQVLVIMPQIADIEFLLGFLGLKFGAKLAVLHRQMGKTEEYANWARIRENRAKIVLGTRSGILAPLKNPGLVIIDEEDSADHKQYDMNPRYDARRIALMIGTKVVFSSSAPRIEIYYKSEALNPKSEAISKFKYQNSKLELVKLTGKAVKVELVDMKNELSRGKYSPISLTLEERIKETLETGKKAILFLNRKGMATMTVCADCNFLFECERCQMPLIYHESAKQLVCHRCGFKQDTPLSCPKCQGSNIKFVGTGTERVEREARKLFPDKKVIRIDKDARYYKLDINKYDIIIGTQLLLKDFKVIGGLSFLGIISLDIMLSRPDFRAGEKLYQLVSKLLVWAKFNRAEKVLWQTFSFENDLILTAGRQDYEKFFEREIEQRKALDYPPFCKLVKLIYKSPDLKKAEQKAERLANNLRGLNLAGTRVIGPIEPLVRKVGANFIEIVILKLMNLDEIKKIPLDALRGWLADVEPESVD